jgi:glycosyltransferase involved in cell wall biosynthesis
LHKKNSILLIGPYPKNNSSHLGGTTILFKNLVDLFIEKNISFRYISIIRYTGFLNKMFNYFFVVLSSIGNLRGIDAVIINVNRNGLKYLIPILYIIFKTFKVKVILRIFGCFCMDELDRATIFQKIILTGILKKSDLLFYETKIEVQYFKQFNSNTNWFPNCRNYNLTFNKRHYNKKFVYIGQVNIDKGILILLEAFEKLGKEFTLEIYGPILNSELSFIKKTPYYKGILSFSEVNLVIKNASFVILPTFHWGEGYPGIIIESYALSVPVITTRWKSIPEIVKDGESGILIQPRSVDELKKAILNMTDELYLKLNKGAYEMSKQFQSSEVHKTIINKVQEVLRKR